METEGLRGTQGTGQRVWPWVWPPSRLRMHTHTLLGSTVAADCVKQNCGLRDKGMDWKGPAASGHHHEHLCPQCPPRGHGPGKCLARGSHRHATGVAGRSHWRTGGRMPWCPNSSQHLGTCLHARECQLDLGLLEAWPQAPLLAQCPRASVTTATKGFHFPLLQNKS